MRKSSVLPASCKRAAKGAPDPLHRNRDAFRPKFALRRPRDWISIRQERFQAKWSPVRVKKTRQNKN